MSFDANNPKITAYVLGELDEPERAEFEAELSASAELRDAVEQIRQTVDQLAGELQAEPPVTMSVERSHAVQREIDRRHELPHHITPSLAARRAGRRRMVRVFAMAGSLLLLCGGTALWLIGNARHWNWRSLGGRHAEVAQVVDSSASTSSADPEASAIEFMPGVQMEETYAMPDHPAADLGTDYGGKAALESLQRHSVDEKSGSRLSMDLGPPPSSAPNPERAWSQLSELERRSGHALGSGPASKPEGVSAREEGYGFGGRGRSELHRRASELQNYHDTYRAFPMPRQEGQVPAGRPDHGVGPGLGGDKYLPIVENPFREVKQEPRSTFSIDVDTASYSKVRMYLLQHGAMPRPDAVRIEELINYFTYDYAPPSGDQPFAAHLEVAECPWAPAHRLVRIGIKGREIQRDKRPASNLVFLLDVSGSMAQPNKLPLVKYGMKLLVNQLGENDRVAIVVYAGAAGMVLDSTTGDRQSVILDALDRLNAGGSTNGGQGIRLAYQTALDHFIRGGINRVILCTDGDFNVGVTGTDELVRIAEQNAKAGVFLSVLGFGMGNHNDAMLEQLADKGNGNYAFIDTAAEARKVLVEQMTGTLITIAKDVKIQVEFNPQGVAAYRLIGYENRMLATQDFNDDKKDAGEIGAGHTVTALYEIVPADVTGSVLVPPVDDLRYQTQGKPSEAAQSGELLVVKIRFKQPDGDTSSKLEFPLRDAGQRFGQASRDFRFAGAVAAFGMLLRDSQFKGSSTYAGVQEIATEAASGDTTGYRDEFLRIIARARQVSGR